MSQKLEELIAKLFDPGPVLPGSLKQYYNVCGKADCRCKDKENPVKHGPYYRLSYSVKGNNSSMFVNDIDAYTVQEMVSSYKESRNLVIDIGIEMIALCKAKGPVQADEIYQKLFKEAQEKSLGGKPDSKRLMDLIISREKWKENAKKQTQKLKKNSVTIRDLKNGRERWRSEASELRTELIDKENLINELSQRFEANKNPLKSGAKKSKKN